MTYSLLPEAAVISSFIPKNGSTGPERQINIRNIPNGLIEKK
jgi:hypothetical protein